MGSQYVRTGGGSSALNYELAEVRLKTKMPRFSP
jgi:hypothetical protein